MHTSDERLAAFLAGELDPDAARAVDEHLLECEDCWHAVRAARTGRQVAERLRRPAPPVLADRIRLAVELAPTASRKAAPKRPRGRWAVVAAGTAGLITAIVLAVLLVPRHAVRRDPPVIAALVRVAAQPESAPASTRLAGQPVDLRRYSVAGGTALVATSPRAFPTPPDAHLRPGSAMAWTITRGPVTVYCPHAKVVLAGTAPASTLVTLAGRLHLN